MPARQAAVLPRCLVQRWNALPAFDRAHLVAVARRLDISGADADLVLAGLLHDIGKPAHTGVIARVLGVILANRAVSLTSALARVGIGPSIASQVRELADHPHAGADLLREAGLPARIVSLVRRHHDVGDGDPALFALRSADDASALRRGGTHPW